MELRKCHHCGTITERDVCPRCRVSVINDAIRPAEDKTATERVTKKTRTTKTNKTGKTI